MAKTAVKTHPLVGKKIKNYEDLGNGWVRITFEDGTIITALLAPAMAAVLAAKGKTSDDDDDDDDDDEPKKGKAKAEPKKEEKKKKKK